jgi:hypothetical protein
VGAARCGHRVMTTTRIPPSGKHQNEHQAAIKDQSICNYSSFVPIACP